MTSISAEASLPADYGEPSRYLEDFRKYVAASFRNTTFPAWVSWEDLYQVVILVVLELYGSMALAMADPESMNKATRIGINRARGAWYKRICRAKQEGRKPVKDVPLTFQNQPVVASGDEASAMRLDIERVLAGLSPLHRRVWQGKLEGRKNCEIAVEVGLKPQRVSEIFDTIRHQLTRALS